MKNVIANIGYFIKEAKTIIRLNLVSNSLSLLSTGLIFFILAMVISGWWVSNQVVEVLQGEAEINVYYQNDLSEAARLQLIDKIKLIEGVREARVVNETEAQDRMVEILGQEAQVLEYFDDSPFSAFIEVKISLEEIDEVLEEMTGLSGISHIRDNRQVLDRLKNIAETLKLLGYLVITAVGISTLVIISHMIRLGIHHNQDQINTLRLLGAPETFIALPFLLGGLFLTLGGGLLAIMISAFTVDKVYGQLMGPLPFLPLPSKDTLLSGIIILLLALSGILGLIGSLFGLKPGKNH